jgi:hypothetical protein
MKNIMIYILIWLFAISCKSSKIEGLNPEEAIITYSKSRCFGRCPVYDLYIFNDGKILYKGIENVSKTGTYQSTINLEELDRIKLLLNNLDIQSNQNKLIRDMPVTTLIFNGTKTTYNETKIPENLKIVNDLIKKGKNKIAFKKLNQEQSLR